MFTKKNKQNKQNIENYLYYYPIRTYSKWYVNEGDSVVIVLPVPKKHFLRHIMGFIIQKETLSDITFDPRVSKIWLHCDGHTSINQMVHEFLHKYPNAVFEQKPKNERESKAQKHIDEKMKIDDMGRRIALTVSHFVRNGWVTLLKEETHTHKATEPLQKNNPTI